MKYTVIATSGWQGDHWRYVRQFTHRAKAVEHAEKIQVPDAQSKFHITAVIGDVKVDGYDYVGDTSRVNVNEKHLRSRRCYIEAEPRM